VFFAAVNIINIAMGKEFLLRYADAPPSDRRMCNLIQCVIDQN